MTARARAARLAGAVAALALAAATLTACIPPGDTAKVTVGSNGFTAQVADVTVTAPAGVAPEGTTVELEKVDAPVPAEVGSFAAPVAEGVSLTLDGGALQPAQPMQVTFEVPEADAGGTVFVLGEDETTGTGVAFVESVWDAEQRKVTATIDHLSWFAPVKVDDRTFGEKLGAWIDEAAGTRSQRPECATAEQDLRFTAVEDDVVWPCATETDDGVEFRLQSNSGLVWEMLTRPTAEYRPLTSLTLSGIATIEAVNLIGEGLEGDTVVLPMETTKGTFTVPADEPYEFVLQVEPGLSQIATIMFGLSMIFPSKWMELVGKASCLADISKTATSAPSGETFRTILGCAGEFIGATAGNLISIILTGPGLLASQLEGLAREITQTNTVRFTLAYTSPSAVDTLPAEASWLYDLPQEIVPQGSVGVVAVIPGEGGAVVFDSSTSLWVGCGERPHKVTFYLDGDYTELSFGLGLQSHTPEGLTATVTMQTASIEDRMKPMPSRYEVASAAWTLQRGDIIERQTFDVTGAWFVSFSAQTSDSCGSADVGYAALLDAYVR